MTPLKGPTTVKILTTINLLAYRSAAVTSASARGLHLRARRGELCIDLNLRDLKILTLLHEHPGKVLDRNTLFNACWGLDYAPNSRALDQHISQLRKKIEHDPKEPKIIQTVHGAGYRYDPPEL